VSIIGVPRTTAEKLVTGPVPRSELARTAGGARELMSPSESRTRQEGAMSERRHIETGTDDLLAWVEDHVAVLTMNRPQRRNALSTAMLTAMSAALQEAETDPGVRCVVLTGAGEAFCAGGDVKGMEETRAQAGRGLGLDDAIHRQRLAQRGTAGRLYEMPKPTIAMLPGAAAGAGLSLALACDLRIASERAILTTAFAKVGFSGDFGGTFFMSQLIGAAKTRELYYLSEKIDARTAEQIGLVNRVVPAATLEQETLDLARRLAHGPTIAYRYMKENINRALAGASARECLDLEATHHVHTGLTEDHRNAVKAFVEKRPPVFNGH
jgi:2-(1,2-epoxy-1,2-dihydrophenyl)acetyl-CoA isomerase